MSKLFLLTMTQNRESDIREMIKNIYPTFDGIVALVNQPSTDKTQEILESNKGSGRVLTQKFTPHHGFLMNHLLFYGGLKDGDWCLFLDSPERATDLFIQDLPRFIKTFEKNDIGALYWDGRPYLFQFSEYLEFFYAVHWGLSGITGKTITNPDKDHYIINTRKKNPGVSFCLNGCKYYVVYGLGNEVQSTYAKYGQDTVVEKEKERRETRRYLREVLDIDLANLDGLITYMRRVENKEITPPQKFVDYVENQYRLSELYQLEVLKMDFMTEIAAKRHRWSFKEHLNSGNGWVEGYVGEINVLNRRYGLPPE